METWTMVRTMMGTTHHGRRTMVGATAMAGAGTRHRGANTGASKRRCKDYFVDVHCFTSCWVTHVERQTAHVELTPYSEKITLDSRVPPES